MSKRSQPAVAISAKEVHTNIPAYKDMTSRKLKKYFKQVRLITNPSLFVANK
jgi:hypothetical protein